MVTMSFYRRGGGRPASVMGKLGLSLFFFLFFAIGSFFALVVLQEFGRTAGQRAWKKVPCTILTSEVQEREGDGEPYVFAVRYRYARDGQPYEGSGYRRNYSGGSEYSEAQELVQEYPAGLSTSCYVNPTNAGEAVLKRDSLLIGLVLLFPLIFVVIGAGGLYITWRRQPPEEARPIAPVAGKRSLGKLGLAAFFGIFAIVGGVTFYFLSIQPIASTIAAESWVETPCKVLRAEVRNHKSDKSTTYSVYVLYEYELGGQTYKSDRYDFVGGSSSGYEGKARVVETYQSAERPVCYVNPANPSEAVLKRGFHAKLLVALFPLPFLLVGVIGVVCTLRRKRPRAVGTGSLGPAGQMGSMGSADAGRQILTPTSSPRGKFIVVMIAAIVWNGVVSLIVIGSLGGSGQGGSRPPGGLFMFLFVAAGIGLAAAAVYQFLAMFNPRPTVELSTGRIPLGGTAEVQWSFSGRAGRIRELVVMLRGVEEARYRTGKNTHTDSSTFYELELYRTADLQEIASGQVGFVIPGDTMHSFEAANNKILWSLDVHGSIERWPDVNESFKINVAPKVA
jgi:hypothetical protein